MNTGKTILGALNYNENKVKSGDAECISENMFGCEPSDLSFSAKKKRFDQQMQHNQRSKTNVVHISLNFGMQEKLQKETLKSISDAYMDKIGFGNQPYLVYQHFDAAHSHVHILTTSIQDNGKRIPLHNMGRNQSEKARKEIEEMFNLVRAEGREPVNEQLLDLRLLERAQYGKAETKQTISKIVRTITRSYKYTSIAELNAVLLQYNVVADRGKEGTIMHQRNGMLYSLVDRKGNRVGVPIKASSIYAKPTLANLEKQFKLNEALRKPLKKRLQDKIDQTFLNKGNPKLADFVKALQKENIQTVFRQNEAGRVYGVTFVDHQQRVVFNGSDLGKPYSAKAIMERLTEIPSSGPINQIFSKPAASDRRSDSEFVHSSSSSGIEQVLKDLTTADLNYQGADPALVRRKRKKRRRKSI